VNIALIGYRGTGKTTVARHLAAALDCEWVDSDDAIEQSAGKSIASIFADDGEPHFRDVETRVLDELCKRDNVVLSLGGGIVLRRENRDMLADFEHVVWLTADVDTIHQRVSADEQSAERRPNLTIAGGRQEIADVLAERSPVYRECATLQVDTVDKPPEAVAREILASIS
jgi:shikimate kinase